MERLSLLYDKQYVFQVERQLADLSTSGTENGRESYLGLREKFIRKMWDLEDGEAARIIAPYIDINPVRAGMFINPKDYRFCSYAEAVGKVGKGNLARRGIARVLEEREGVLSASGRFRQGDSDSAYDGSCACNRLFLSKL